MIIGLHDNFIGVKVHSVISTEDHFFFLPQENFSIELPKGYKAQILETSQAP